jgi:hypothetical protein
MSGDQLDADAAPEATNQHAGAKSPPTNSLLLLLNQRAKERFLSTYEGAFVELPTTFYNRSVVRHVKRYYMRGVMDWHLATSLVAAKLHDRGMARQIEMAMLQTVGEIHAHFTGLNNRAKVIIDTAELDESCITHSTSHQEKLVVLGPVAVKMRNTLMLCDKYLDRIALLYTMGEIDQQASSEASHDVKLKLSAITTSLRMHRTAVLRALRERGITRDSYRSVEAAAEAMVSPAQAQDADDDSASSKLAPITDLASVPRDAVSPKPLAAAA